MVIAPLAIRHLQRRLPSTKWDDASKMLCMEDTPRDIMNALKEAIPINPHYHDVRQVRMKLKIASLCDWQEFAAVLCEFLLLLRNCARFTLTHEHTQYNTGIHNLPILVVRVLVETDDLSRLAQQLDVKLHTPHCDKPTSMGCTPAHEDIEIAELNLEFGDDLRWDVYYRPNTHRPSQYLVVTAGRRRTEDAYAVWHIRLVKFTAVGATPAIAVLPSQVTVPTAMLDMLDALQRQVKELGEQLSIEQNRSAELASRFECPVCLSANGMEKNAVFIGCGHTACVACAKRLSLSVCHICRDPYPMPCRMYI